MECIFCDGKLKEFIIKKFKYWTIYLNENQYYLGRVYIALNRHGSESTVELGKLEWIEFKDIIDKITKIVKKLYNYNLMNYLILQNKDRNHFHMHLIPRYESSRFFYGKEFKDELWGKPPIPTPKIEFDKELLMKIIIDLKKEL